MAVLPFELQKIEPLRFVLIDQLEKAFDQTSNSRAIPSF